MQAQQPKGLKDAAHQPEKQRQVSNRVGTAMMYHARPSRTPWFDGRNQSFSFPPPQKSQSPILPVQLGLALQE